jgi:hypothetical protein
MDGESQKQKTSNLKVVFALSAARFVPFALLIPYGVYSILTPADITQQ